MNGGLGLKNSIIERWKKFIDDSDDNDSCSEDEIEVVIGEWNSEDDYDYPSRRESRRLKSISKPQRTSWVPGADNLAKGGLASGISEDLFFEDNIEGVDVAYLRGIISQATKDAISQQMSKNGCTFAQLIRMLNVLANAEKGKLNGD